MVDTLNVRVTLRHDLALDIALFELVCPQGNALPAFTAGSHIDVHGPRGHVRQYSLCNDPAESHRYQIAVLRNHGGRGGSQALHEGVKAGDLIRISAPRNHFALVEDAPRSILLGGGIGITPLISMAERLAARGRPFLLHYCTRSPARTAFRERIQASGFSMQTRIYHSESTIAAPVDLASSLQNPLPSDHMYTCGPTGFMEAVLATARTCGWQDGQLHHEFFQATSIVSRQDSAFEVQLASSGRVIPVTAQETVVAALAAHGVSISTSCEQGVCGTCVTHIVGGEAEHRDMFLTKEERQAGELFMPCCSRARSGRLVLDL